MEMAPAAGTIAGSTKKMVQRGGFEPPRSCLRQPLKLVRLPNSATAACDDSETLSRGGAARKFARVRVTAVRRIA